MQKESHSIRILGVRQAAWHTRCDDGVVAF